MGGGGGGSGLKIKLQMTSARVAGAAGARRYRTIVLGPLQDEGRAGHAVADAGERQHLQLVQHELAEPGQQCRLRVVPSHDVTAGLGVQVFGPEQDLEPQRTRVRSRGCGCQEGVPPAHGQDQLTADSSPQQLCSRLTGLVSIHWCFGGKPVSGAGEELES